MCVLSNTSYPTVFRVCLFTCFSSCLIYSSSGNAADWLISPSITALYSYIDNVDLSETQPRSDSIFSVTPGISATKTSSRMEVKASYALQVVRYRENKQADDEYNLGELQANFHIVPDTFELETNANYGQQPIAVDAGPVAPNSYFITTNRANVLTYSVKPIFKYEHGKYAAFYADYTYQGYKADAGGAGNNNIRNTIEHVAITNPKTNQRLLWSLEYMRNRFDITGVDNDYVDTKASLSYLLTPRFSLIATGGKEENDVTSTLLGGGDTYWYAGFNWKPSTRTTVQIQRGERFFGKSTRAFISHQSHRTEFSLSYNESLTSTATIQINNAGITSAPIIPVANDFVLQKAFALTWKGKSARTDFGLDLNSSKLTYQTTLAREDYNTGNLFISWRSSAMTTWQLSAGRQEIKMYDTNATYDFDTKQLSYLMQHGRNFNTTVTIANYKNASNTGINNYTANYYGLSLTWHGR